MKIKRIIFLFLYYCIFRYLPVSYHWIFGTISKRLRYICAKNIFKSCGYNVNIERLAHFGNGKDIEIGDNSGLGINCCVPNNIKIGKNVMMGPNCYILAANHKFDRIDIPMIQQGETEVLQTIIYDDVWIGRNVLLTPGRLIQTGTIIGAGALVSKDFPPYSVIGGNPAKVIKSRLNL